MISEEEYARWEKQVIESFFDATKRPTQLTPIDGVPSVLSKEKVILVLMGRGGLRAEQVSASAKEELPSKSDLQIFHFGKGALDGVSYGLKQNNFLHPACDAGGLTNYKQELGSAADFIGPSVSASNGDNLGARSSALFEAWSEVAGITLPEAFRRDLESLISSGLVAFTAEGGLEVRFHKLPPEHRVIVTSNDVRARTGKYYERIFGGEHFARESDGVDLYCAVTEKFITPNINTKNLLFEYRQYTEEEMKSQRILKMFEAKGICPDGTLEWEMVGKLLKILDPGRWTDDAIDTLSQAVQAGCASPNGAVQCRDFVKWALTDAKSC